jgi:hypothetical protein
MSQSSPQPAQVVGGLGRGDWLGAQLPGDGFEVGGGEPVRVQTEHGQGLKQRVGSFVVEAEPGHPGAGVGHSRPGYRVEGLLALGRVEAESLDVQESSVGFEADLA